MKSTKKLDEATRVLIDMVRDLVGDPEGCEGLDPKYWPKPPTNLCSVSSVIDDLRVALRAYDDANAEE